MSGLGVSLPCGQRVAYASFAVVMSNSFLRSGGQRNMNGWLDLKHAAEYTSLSVRTLRRYIGDAHHPLPVRIVGGKWLTHPSDLDQWIKDLGAKWDQRLLRLKTLIETGKTFKPH